MANKNTTPRKRNILSDIDSGIILNDVKNLREKISLLQDSGVKNFLILHTERIIIKLEKRMESRGGTSLIEQGMKGEE